MTNDSPKSPKGPWLTWGLGVVAVALMVAILVPRIGGQLWWVQTLNFAQVQFAILLIVVAIAIVVFLDLKRRFTQFLVAALAACGAYQANFLLPYTPLAAKQLGSASSCAPDNRLRILTLNVLRGNDKSAPVLDLVRSIKPDLFLAQEADPAWKQALQPLKNEYPHVVDAARDGYWGMMLFSRLPLANPEVRYLVEDYVPSIRTGVRLPSGAVATFYGLHPKPPLGNSIVAKGDAEILHAGREIRQRAAPAVLAGDLNDVPWSHTLQRFQRESGMRDPRVGRGLYPTYKTNAPLMRWPIDHVFASHSFRILGYEKLADVGSDHFPVLATLCLRSNGR